MSISTSKRTTSTPITWDTIIKGHTRYITLQYPTTLKHPACETCNPITNTLDKTWTNFYN